MSTLDFGVAPDSDLPDEDLPDLDLPDAAPLIDAAAPPVIIESVETVLSSPSTAAGRRNQVTCQALDPEGVPVMGVSTRFEVRPAAGWSRPPAGEDGSVPSEVIGADVGVYQITCVAPSLGLRDVTPARWDVLPGPPARLRAEAQPEATAAGEPVEITCEALDAAGNPVPLPEAVVVISPEDPANTVTYPDPEAGGPITATFTRAGHYTVSCAYKDAASGVVAEVDVRPGPPAQLLASLFPDQALYLPGQVVEVVPLVTDRYGNTITDAPLSWASEPVIGGFGDGRFRPAEEGRYQVGVAVEGPTDGARPLSQWLDVVVDAGGPAIQCDLPVPGAQVVVPEGGVVRLEGQVNDVAGVARFTVDGVPVAIDPEGRFSVEIDDPAWGLNLHRVVAEDAGGQTNTTWCTYFASPSYAPDRSPIDDTIRLSLGRVAIDDGAPATPVSSVADLIRAVVESDALVETLHQQLLNQNPVVPTTCQARILGQCIFSLGAEYRDLRIEGARSTTLVPIDGGLRFTLRLEDVVLEARLRGTLTNRGTITASYIEAFLTFDVSESQGRPQIALREVERLRIGDMDPDFDGVITGTALDLIFEAFESLIRDELIRELQAILEQQVDSLLTDVLTGLDISALSAAFPIPDPDGGPPVPITVSVAISSVVADAQGLALGVYTQTAGRIGEGSRSLGVPSPPEAFGCTPSASSPPASPRTASAIVRIPFLNQMLHQVWRAGLFRLDLSDELAEGVTANFRLMIPPAAEIPGGDTPDLRLHFGPLEGSLGYAGLFDEPIRFRISAILSLAVSLDEVGGEPTLAFGDIEIEAFALDFPGVVVSQEARPALESVLLELVEGLVVQGLSEALPSLPIPDFALPDSLSDYGVPPGTRLGIRDLRLRHRTGCWLLEGRLAP